MLVKPQPEKAYHPIDECAFEDCKRLTRITIPVSVEYIGRYAFDGCTKLKDVYYKGTDSEWEEVDIDSGNEAILNAVIHCKSSVGSGDIPTSGKCGDNANWSFENGTLTVSGTGKMNGYSSYDYEYSGKRAYRYIFPPEHFNNCRSDRNNIQIRQKKP